MRPTATPEIKELAIKSSSFDWPDAEELFQRIRTLPLKPQLALHLDLSRVTFICPAGIAALISAARLWHGLTKQKLCLARMQPQIHKYLDRIDLFSVCGAFIAADSAVPEADRLFRSKASSSLLEVIPIASRPSRNETDVQQAIKRTGQILEAHYHYALSSPAIVQLQKLVSELATNVVHSRDTGYMVVQSYDRKWAESRVDIAITDAGIGIEGSLRGRLPLPPSSGSGYILQALQEGVSGQKERRGIGLSEVRKVVAQWRGALIIRSGASRVDICAGQNPHPCDGLPPIPGTQVYITVNGVFAP